MSAHAAPVPASHARGDGRGDTAALRLMADYAPVMIWLAGADRKFVHVNRRWLEFTGRPLESELGFGWSEALHSEDRARVLGLYERAFEECAPFEAQFRLRRCDGTWRWMAAKGVPLPHQHEREPEGFVGSCVDLNEFLAIVSHELRSPLNGIKSWTHVLENLLPDAQPPVQRALAGILIGVDHQVRLIDLLAGTDVAASHGCTAMAERTSMPDRKSATTTKAESDKRRADALEHPEHGPDPDTLEGAAGRHEAEGDSDAGDKVTRRGER